MNISVNTEPPPPLPFWSNIYITDPENYIYQLPRFSHIFLICKGNVRINASDACQAAEAVWKREGEAGVIGLEKQKKSQFFRGEANITAMPIYPAPNPKPPTSHRAPKLIFLLLLSWMLSDRTNLKGSSCSPADQLIRQLYNSITSTMQPVVIN